MVVKLSKEAPRTFVFSSNHTPSKEYWSIAVNQALKKISRRDSELTKVISNTCTKLGFNIDQF